MKHGYLHLKLLLSIIYIIIFNSPGLGQGIISGTITSAGKPVPFVNVGIKETSWGTVSDVNGAFTISPIPFGDYTLEVSHVGYERISRSITITSAKKELKLDINLRQMMKSLDEVVVTGTRYEKRKLDSAIPVNILDSRVMEATSSQSLADGLTFQPGIRVEKDCQTCNYTQIRMNGLPGSYSQILINSKPLMSSLAGLYGLEQIPVSMIERVEVVRGGGSVLFGSSAIAGTINIITRDPIENRVDLSLMGSTIRESSYDQQSDLFASLVNHKRNAGTSLILSQRNREPWDANNDGFSELAKLENLSIGLNSWFRINEDAKLRIGLNRLHEVRNGGDQLGREPHHRLQSEWRDSEIKAGNVDYSHTFFAQRTDVELSFGAQQTDREHYTGAFGADGYGTTDNHTLIAGARISHTLLNFIKGKNRLSLGSDYQYDYVHDQIEAYNYLIKQETFQTGIYFQSDWDITNKLNVLSGVRWSKHNMADEHFWTPRVGVLYKLNTKLQARASRSEGFRAPQAFDTDMHIAFAGGGVALTIIDPALRPERSVSYAASLDFNNPQHHYIYGFTLSGFHTRLKETFILEQIPDSMENVTLLRTNGSDATVAGITLEARFNYNYKLEGEAGFTWQFSLYDEPVAWSSSVPGGREFLRTPSSYGYYTVSWLALPRWKFSISGVYTGTMRVPHYAGAPGVEQDHVINSGKFYEMNLQAEWEVVHVAKGMPVKIKGGVQNLWDSFQSDFDTGPNRDSNFMYGPGRPRTLFLGISVGFRSKTS
jgi:outer membrane receptor for ferrienterochelin and colicins